MSGRIIPKETLSSYQSWQMEAFERRSAAKKGEPQAAQEAAGEDDSSGSKGAAAGEAYGPGYEAGQQAGYEAGYEVGRNAGYQAGRDAGYEAGYEAGAGQADAEAQCLGGLLQQFQQELSAADQVIAQDLLSLALGLAQQMIRETLRLKPELVCAVVRECLRQERVFNQPAQLFLNPEDAALVRQHLDQELVGWSVCIDAQIERGGCRIKVGHAEVDATVGTRWQRITQVLGQSAPWME